MHKIIFFSRKKNVCLSYLKFSDPLPETHLFFIWHNASRPKVINFTNTGGSGWGGSGIHYSLKI